MAHVNPLQYIRESREKRKIGRIAFSVLEGMDLSNSGFEDCDKLRRRLNQALNEAGFKTTKVRVTSNPLGYLKHVVRPNQVEHEAVAIGSHILDPLYPTLLPVDEYLKKVYKPEDGVELIVTFQHA